MAKAHIQAKEDHPFRIVKQKFSFQNAEAEGNGGKSLQRACARPFGKAIPWLAICCWSQYEKEIGCVHSAESEPNRRGLGLAIRPTLATTKDRAERKPRMEQIRHFWI
jgi:hypothetical protein